MRVDASSGNLVGAGSLGVGTVVGSLMYLGWLPFSSGVVLLVTSAVFTVIAFAGAHVARRNERALDVPSPVKNTPPNITAAAAVRQAYQGTDGRIRVGAGPAAVGSPVIRYAALATFRNDSAPGQSTRDVYGLTAHVTMFGRTVTGCWIEQDTRTIDLLCGSAEQAVILAFVEESRAAYVVSDERDGPSGKIALVTFATYPSNGSAPTRRETLFTVVLSEAGQTVRTCEYLLRLSLGSPELNLVSDSGPADPEPSHNLLCVGAEERTVYPRDNGFIATRPVIEGEKGLLAVVAVFANRPSKKRQVAAVRGVKASVAPIHSTMHIPSGWWLDESSASVDFEPGGPVRELLLVYKDSDDSVWAVEDRREPDGRVLHPRHFTIFGVGHLMGGLTVTVELSANGRVVHDSTFAVDLLPFGVRLVGQHQHGCPDSGDAAAATDAVTSTYPRRRLTTAKSDD